MRVLLIVLPLLVFPLSGHSTYISQDGRISYLLGATLNTNYQENLFNDNDNPSKPGRSQSFAILIQALGDISPKGSLMAEVNLGTHKFLKRSGDLTDEYRFDAIGFDLGYRRHIGGRYWWSAQIGSLYPWRVDQDVRTLPTKFDESEFASLYSVVLGIQYEHQINNQLVSYDFRIRKYMSSQIDDQIAIGLGVGWRFGLD